MGKNLRILHITTSYPKSSGDTSGIFVKNLVDALEKNGVYCEVLTSSGSSPRDFCCEKVKTFRYAPWKWQCLCHNPGGIPACIKKKPYTICLLPSFLVNMCLSIIRRTKNFDLIHCHWSVSGAMACLGKRFHRKKIVTTLRGSDHYLAKGNPYSYLHNLALKQSDAVVTVSESILNDICKKYPNRKNYYLFIPNGIGDDFYNVNTQQRPTPPPFIFLYTGSLIKLKGLDTVIMALSLLKDIDFKFIVVGEGDEKEFLHRLTKEQGIDDKVQFLGAIPHDKIPDLIQNCHLFILASHREGRSNSLLEAMASAVPVIVSDIEANRELIVDGENGFIFPAGDHHALANKIRNFCLNYSKYKDIGIKGREKVQYLGLNWDSCAISYINLYKSLTGI